MKYLPNLWGWAALVVLGGLLFLIALKLTGSGLVVSVIAGVLVVFVTFFAESMRRSLQTNEANLNMAVEKIRELGTIRNEAALKNIKNNLEHWDSLQAQFEEFCETTFTTSKGVGNTLNVDSFFDSESFIGGLKAKGARARAPFVHQLPPLATGIGLMGTFIGVTLSLGAVDTGSIKESIPSVISGLSSAFYTSIFGVASALWISMRTAYAEDGLRAAFEDLKEAIDRAVPRISGERLIDEQTAMLQGQLDALKEKLAETHAGNHKVLKELDDSTAALVDHGDDIKEILQTLGTDMAETLGNKIDASLGNLLGSRMEEMVNLIRKQVDSTTDNSVEMAKNFTEELVKSLQEGVGQKLAVMGDQVANAGSEFSAAAGTMDGFHKSVDKLLSRVDEESKMIERLEKAALHLSSLLERSEPLLESTALLAKELESQRVSSTAVLGLMEAQQGSAQEAASTMQNVVLQANDSIGIAAAQFSSVGKQFEGFSLAVNRLAERAGDEALLIEKLENGAKHIGDLMVKTQPTMKAVAELALQLSEERTRSAHVVESLKLQQEESFKATVELKEGMETAKVSLNESAASIRTTIFGVEGWASETNEALEGFSIRLNEGLGQTLEKYDESLAKAVGSLTTSMRQLSDVAEELQLAGEALRD